VSQNPDNQPPIEVDAEPFEDAPRSPGPPGSQTYVYYANPEPSCCTGCGCLLIGFLLIILLMPGTLVSTVIMVLAAGWLSVVLLRLFRISRYSPAYVYVLVPVFLSLVSLLGQAIRDKAPYGAREVVIGTLVIYAVLFLSDTFSRRRNLR
jgi:hypothetical protein